MDDAMTEYDAINAGWPRCIIDLAAEKRRRPSLWSRIFP